MVKVFNFTLQNSLYPSEFFTPEGKELLVFNICYTYDIASLHFTTLERFSRIREKLSIYSARDRKKE